MDRIKGRYRWINFEFHSILKTNIFTLFCAFYDLFLLIIGMESLITNCGLYSDLPILTNPFPFIFLLLEFCIFYRFFVHLFFRHESLRINCMRTRFVLFTYEARYETVVLMLYFLFEGDCDHNNSVCFWMKILKLVDQTSYKYDGCCYIELSYTLVVWTKSRAN